MFPSMDSIVHTGDSKYINMKQFIAAFRNYLPTKTEDTANLLNRHLQLLSVTIDLSIFDPHTNVVSEFFVCLYELLSNIEPRSSLAWCCVNVLATACRNSASRKALIHTYQFLPLLSRLLGDHLSTEKKLRLLTLMQELTCGIKISWQIPHLPHLMATLMRWIESSGDEEIVNLSLGVLVNLCYKNLPAVYTLSRCIDIKRFVRTCMSLKGLKIEVHVCKLLIILDYMNGQIPEGAFLKLTEVTFKSMMEAFRARDCMLLRHIVEFYLDMWQQNNHSDTLVNYENHDVEVQRLLQVVEEARIDDRGDTVESDPECMALLFEFLHFLLELKLPKLEPLHPHIVNLVLKWVNVDLVCSSGLQILRTIALTRLVEKSTGILEPFLDSLPVFLMAIDNDNYEIPTNIESNKKLSALMELLRVLVKAENTRPRVLALLREEVVMRIFAPLLGDNLVSTASSSSTMSPKARASCANTYTPEAILLYVNAIALIDEIVTYDMQWINMHRHLMQQRQIHMILAQALFFAPKEAKTLIMSMTSNHFFPIAQVAAAMYELQPLMHSHPQASAGSTTPGSHTGVNDNMCFSVMSVTQIERLDDLMEKLKGSYEQNNMANVSTSDVMELYEYKLSTMNHAERAAIASVEAASQRCTHLQHRCAQLNAELSRLHQLLLHAERSHEEAVKIKDNMIAENKQLRESMESEKRRNTSKLLAKEKQYNEKCQVLEDTAKRLKLTEDEKSSLEEKHVELKRLVSKLEENLLKKEKVVEKKEEQIAKLNVSNEHLKMQITQLEKQLMQSQGELTMRTKELADTANELKNCKHIIGTITQLTSSQYLK